MWTVTERVAAPLVNVVDGFLQVAEPGAQADTSVVPVPVAPRYAQPPCTPVLSVQAESGWTATVRLRRASSWSAGVAFSAAEPPCAGEETVVPLPAEQVRFARPDPNPALRASSTSAADAWPIAGTVSAGAAVTAAAQMRVRLRLRARSTGGPPVGEPSGIPRSVQTNSAVTGAGRPPFRVRLGCSMCPVLARLVREELPSGYGNAVLRSRRRGYSAEVVTQ
ncbi:hypothetical protein GCM10020295_29400 [Streptomyces cinereospinus]